MEKRFIVRNLKNEDYKIFLQFCRDSFDCFYLYIRSDLGSLSKKGEDTIEQLKSELINHTIGDEFLSGEKMYDKNIYLNIYKYKCSDTGIQLLSQLRSSLFSWRMKNSPEDLSFENSINSCKFYSIAHESFAVLEGSESLIKKFDEMFPLHSLTEKEYSLIPANELDKDWILGDDGNYIFIGEDDE